MPRTITHPEIDTNIFSDNQASGGSRGFEYVFLEKQNGAIMTKLKAWKDDWRIRGFEIWMSNGTSRLVGTRYGSGSEFTISGGEVITKLNIQSSGRTSSGGYNRLGAIYIQTSKNRTWGIYSNHLDESGRYWPPVGSGIVCGIFGAAGDDVDSLGFAMLNPINEARLVDVVYPHLDMEIVASTPETAVSQRFINETTEKQPYTLSESKTVTIRREWSKTTAMEFALSTTVKAGIPEVASVDATSSWTISSSSTHSRSEEISETQSWSWKVMVPPHRQVLATGVMYSDDIDTEYEASMEILLVNGYNYKYQVKGMYYGLNARSGEAKLEDLGPA